MKCPDCQADLTQVPTSHGPGLDVCFSGHGLWLDVGEVNFFVEDYTSLKRAIGDRGGVAVRTETLCPRCKDRMGNLKYSFTRHSYVAVPAVDGGLLTEASLI